MNLRFPQNAGNFLSSLGRVSFSGRTLLHGVSFDYNQRLFPFLSFFFHMSLSFFKIRILKMHITMSYSTLPKLQNGFTLLSLRHPCHIV